jgi:hypothetical protein
MGMSRLPLRIGFFTSPMALVMRISRRLASVQLIEDRAAAPRAHAIVQDLQPLGQRSRALTVLSRVAY